MANRETSLGSSIGAVRATEGGAELFSQTGRKIGIVGEGELFTDPRGTRVRVGEGGVAITSEPGPDGRVFARFPGSETGSVIKIK